MGLTLGSGAAAANVDAAPPGAIIGIAAQSVRLVNVVGVAVRVARVFEDPRQLTCRELARGLRRYQGKASTLSLTSGNGATQRGAKRNPQKDRSSHCRPCARRIGCCASNPFERHDLCRYGAQGRPDRNFNLFWQQRPRAWDSRGLASSRATAGSETDSNAYPAATPRRMIWVTSDFARSKALSLSGAPPFRVAISCAALAYCCVVAQIM